MIKEKRAKHETVNCLETEELSFGNLLIYKFIKYIISYKILYNTQVDINIDKKSSYVISWVPY